MTEEKNVRAHVVISGRVQGVFFRMNTMRAAERFGVTGWVRNRSDGSVEAVLEGQKAQVDDMLSWCRTGDPPAVVGKVQVQWEAYEGRFESFMITR